MLQNLTNYYHFQTRLNAQMRQNTLKRIKTRQNAQTRQNVGKYAQVTLKCSSR